MGQAVIDLPDPLDVPMPAPSVGADDLISQLAGAEIDRLLAEADATHAPPPEPVAIPPAPPAAIPAPPAAVPQAAENVESRPNTPSRPAAELAGQLGKVLDGLATSNPTAPSTPPPVAPTIVSGLATSPPGIEQVRLTAAEEIALELDAQAPIASDTTSASLDVPANAAAPTAEDDEEPSWLIRTLEWINKPLLSQPDAFREFIGKAAIVTLLNAFAVLVYVLFFRHH